MSSNSTNDLRSRAKSYQRDKNHNAKWARGVKQPFAQNLLCTQHADPDPACAKCIGRPARRGGPKGEARLRQIEQHKLSNHASTLARKAFRNDVVDAMDGPLAHVSDTSSGDEDVLDASEAPIPADADFLYSYDRSGPRAGQDVLSHAITQAVRRFENTETEKLVNNEYDVVTDKEAIGGYTADDDEHDFEMIEHSHLN
ncbi:hypothetical protein B0A52_01439 [Exophiala mesophila]|uniref:Uncharacterized protein n=1 Tax=Exophiala mesophila TaxID=212818 RepID=A0A438NF04_EXOME|nr:hypothetical protein B0A52_01439 [Exophiala mesophila]